MLTKEIFNRVRTATKSMFSACQSTTETARAEFEKTLLRIAQGNKYCSIGKVLIDATYDNPNFWLRLSLLRSALALPQSSEIGILGQYRRKECGRTLRRIGINETLNILPSEDEVERAKKAAKALLEQLSKSEELISLKLPFGLPAALVYDQILKKQRNASVVLRSGTTQRVLVESIAALYAADRILTDDVNLLVLSHTQGVPYGPLAWIGALKKIPVIDLAGGFGSLRFARISALEDIFRIASRPSSAEIAVLSAQRLTQLKETGRAYLEARFSGQTGDLGAIYAYDVNSVALPRHEMVKQLDLNPDRPLVVVYASHWFDMPHIHGMQNFRDFFDWIMTTVDVAKRNPDVNWLFKSHPCEAWYGGVTMRELLADVSAPNLRLVPEGWNGHSTICAADGIITYHGTVGVEAASLGKPVLLADRGWYHDLGFVVWAESREHYIELIGGSWWAGRDSEAVRHNALVFAGLFFAVPDWQRKFTFSDDALQDKLFPLYDGIEVKCSDEIRRELDLLRDWYESGEQYYHIYKMMRATGFGLPTMPGRAVPR